MRVIYNDGVFDLFHRGHLEMLKKTKNIFNDPDNTFVIIGVVSDNDAASYKRTPIINEKDRLEIIKNLKFIDKVIFPAPLVVTQEFMEQYKIDYVAHGFSNDQDRQLQTSTFYKELIDNNKFIEIEYYDKTSTTQIINNILQSNNSNLTKKIVN